MASNPIPFIVRQKALRKRHLGVSLTEQEAVEFAAEAEKQGVSLSELARASWREHGLIGGDSGNKPADAT